MQYYIDSRTVFAKLIKKLFFKLIHHWAKVPVFDYVKISKCSYIIKLNLVSFYKFNILLYPRINIYSH